MSMFKPTLSSAASSSKLAAEVKLNKRGEVESRYPYRLNLSVGCTLLGRLRLTWSTSYDRPPTLDITLDEFETCALARLRVLTHIESLSHRSLPYSQVSAAIATHVKQHLPLGSNTARGTNLEEERRRDEIGHWVLRLSFCRR